MIVRVKVVLNRTFVVDSDWHFDSQCDGQSKWYVSRQLILLNLLVNEKSRSWGSDIHMDILQCHNINIEEVT